MAIRTYEDLTSFKNRRLLLEDKGENSAFILVAGRDSHLTRFRAFSDFIYLTGYEEPESIAVIRPQAEDSFILFVRDKDPVMETWEGYRYGPEGACRVFNSDKAFGLNDFSSRLPELLSEVDKVYYHMGSDVTYDRLVLTALETVKQKLRRSGKAQLPIYDPREILGEMRVIKNEEEIGWQKKACELSVKAHRQVMASISPGMNERQIQADLFHSFYDQKAQREGYSSIIASGSNATVLHYRENNRDCIDGDLLLIDAGAELNYYTADITRTYPVNGKFTSAQKDLYSSVLRVQKSLVDKVKPGFSLHELQEQAIKDLTTEMVDLKLLKGSVGDNILSESYKKYYPHGIGHFLGMDVHDVGLLRIKNQPRPLEAGMVLTVEPGIYVPKDDESAPKELRGLGVRIEDDILVTSDGCENMTGSLEKEISDLEVIIGSQSKK